VLMHLVWAGEALVDAVEPIGEESRVWARVDGTA
jgi:hypothetical protein